MLYVNFFPSQICSIKLRKFLSWILQFKIKRNRKLWKRITLLPSFQNATNFNNPADGWSVGKGRKCPAATYFRWWRDVLPLWAWLCWVWAESLLWSGEWELLLWPLWPLLLPDVWVKELPTAVILPSTLPVSSAWFLLGALWSLCSFSKVDWMPAELAFSRRSFCREIMTNKGKKRKKKEIGQK